MKKTVLKVLALVVPPLAIFTPGLIARTDLNVGEISDQYFSEVVIIPADYAFSIWSFLYLGILALAVVQVTRFGEESHIGRARLPLVVNMVCNFGWLFAWQSLYFGAATVILVAQLITAVWLYVSMGMPGERAQNRVEAALRVPIRAYVAWLTVATVLNLTSLAVAAGWEGFVVSPAVWAAVLLGLTAALGLVVSYLWRDGVFGAVFLWAFIGVALRPGQLSAVSVTAVVLGGLFVVTILYLSWSSYRKSGSEFIGVPSTGMRRA